MDELLREHDEYTGESLLPSDGTDGFAPSRPAWREKLSHSVEKLRDGMEKVRYRVLPRVDAANPVFRFLAPVAFLAASAAIGGLLVLSAVYTPSYQLAVDGVPLGAVKEQGVYEQTAHRVEARVGEILGKPYTLDHDVTYTFALTEKDEIIPASKVENYLFNGVDAVMKSYVLRVNGAFIGAAADQASLTGMLNTLKAPYKTENTTAADFVENVTVTQEYTSSDVEQDLSKMLAALSVNTNGETQYEVQKGESFAQIANDHGMYARELAELNPDQDVNKIYPGQLLNIREEIPFLSVKTTERQVYTEAIPSPVEEKEDETLYQGQTKVLVTGTEGQAKITADVTFVNGKEKGRDVVDMTVLTEPTTKVVAVGTKARPSWLPTGHFRWPTYGTVTSSFGYRYIFGSYSYHSGIDISVPYGSSVKAADGGTVVWSGTGSGSNWSYGKYVVIDHGNGKQTYYAHNSSLLVKVGDKVYQGQTIAKAGSTGRSTGSHCHFQVMINGTAVNPRSYLP